MVEISPGVVTAAEFGDGGGGVGLIVGISPAKPQMDSAKVNSTDPQICRSLVIILPLEGKVSGYGKGATPSP